MSPASPATASTANSSGMGRRFRLVDTGGIVPDDPELIPTEIYNQAKVALEEAAGPGAGGGRAHRAGQSRLRPRAAAARGNKPVFLAVNKVEGEAMADAGRELPPARHSQRLSRQRRARAGHRRTSRRDRRRHSRARNGRKHPRDSRKSKTKRLRKRDLRGRPARSGRRRRCASPAHADPRRIRAARNLDRHHRPPQRRQIHPAERAHRHLARHRLAHRRNHARRRRRSRRVRRQPHCALSTPPASAARARHI